MRLVKSSRHFFTVNQKYLGEYDPVLGFSQTLGLTSLLVSDEGGTPSGVPAYWGVSVYEILGDGNPKFIVFNYGKAQVLLPENPAELQVKHELSHYLDYKKLGLKAYVNLGRAAREQLVLEPNFSSHLYLKREVVMVPNRTRFRFAWNRR